MSDQYVWESPCDGAPVNNQDVDKLGDHTSPPEVRLATPTSALISPNPFKGQFQMQFAAEKEEAYRLVIYDVQGKVLVQKKGQLSKGQNNISVDGLQNMPSGSYFCELISDNHRIYDQLIKN